MQTVTNLFNVKVVLLILLSIFFVQCPISLGRTYLVISVYLDNTRIHQNCDYISSKIHFSLKTV